MTESKAVPRNDLLKVIAVLRWSLGAGGFREREKSICSPSPETGSAQDRLRRVEVDEGGLWVNGLWRLVEGEHFCWFIFWAL